jgi:hypothetical protein
MVQYAIYITGSDGMGPWDPGIYGPYTTEEEAQGAASKFEEETRLANADMPADEWSVETVVCEFLPPNQLLEDIAASKEVREKE